MKKKLLLINPIARFFDNKPFFLLNYIKNPLQPLNLAIIAALTPEHWDIEIFDEISQPFTYREADLVGITSYTGSAKRAYEIAAIYRSKSIPVVMGGIHATLLPDEAQQFVDSVVTGEAEGIWGQVIADFEAGKLQKLYRGGMLPMEGAPFPRHDLLSHYTVGSVQTTRGCPKDCEFCSVKAINGKNYRQRPVEEILDEMERIPQKIIFFVDDNFIEKGREGEERAMALFKGMIERKMKKYWCCQVSLNVADNEELLHHAYKSGCRFVIIGIESENKVALENMGKKINSNLVDRYDEIFKRLHKHKIGIMGSFIFGLDTDKPEDLHRRVRYIKKSRVDAVSPTILTPFPGTRLYKRLAESKRLLFTDYPKDWGRYDFSEVLFEPALMTPEELKKNMIKCWRSLGNWGTLLAKFIKSTYYLRSLESGLIMMNINYCFRAQYYYETCKDKK